MNKWEKIASKIAKREIESLPFLTQRDYNGLKREYLKSFKKHNYNIQDALEYKKWSMNLVDLLIK